jgi:hypothetical protein
MKNLQNLINRLQAKIDNPIYSDFSDKHTGELLDTARKHALELAIGMAKHEMAMLEMEDAFVELTKLI